MKDFEHIWSPLQSLEHSLALALQWTPSNEMKEIAHSISRSHMVRNG